MLHAPRDSRSTSRDRSAAARWIGAALGVVWIAGTAVAEDGVVDWQDSIFTEVVTADDRGTTAPEPPEPMELPEPSPVSQLLDDAGPAAPQTGHNDGAADPFARPPGEYLRSLSEIRVSLETPAEETRAEEIFADRGLLTLTPHSWPTQTPEAAAYRFASGPLWYEDANLERCGYSHGPVLQPVVSGTHFLVTTALLPYHFAAAPPCETTPTKDFCPPGCRYGYCDNYLPDPDLGGGAVQALAITGLIFLIP